MTAGAIRHPGEIYLVVRTRSILACIIHWVLFCSVVTLAVTGFYIAWPSYYFGKGEAYATFTMADMRYYHFVAATFMMTSLLVRFYIAFTESCHKDIKQFLPTPRNIKNGVQLAYHFATGRGRHPHYRFVNPLGGLGIFLIAASLFIMVCTGFLMYIPATAPGTVWHSWAFSIAHALGGLQTVRLIHHVVMYIIFALVLIHVYMQIWKNSVYTESDISSIIAGYKLFPLSQIGHFADYYGIRLHEKPPPMEEMDRASEPVPAREPPG